MDSSHLIRQPLPLGFSTLGLSDHRLDDAVRIIVAAGFDAIGLRLNRRDLNPLSHKIFHHRFSRLVALAPDKTWILEADGPYLLAPEQVSTPTLMDLDGEAVRLRHRLILAAMRAASQIGGIVTLISGPCPDGMEEDIALERLAASLHPLNRHAKQSGVTLALRPTRGSLISRLAHYERLLQWMPENPISLAADIPSMVRGGELPVGSLIARHSDRLACVFAADLQESDQRDLPPGEGHLHWPAIFSGLKTCCFGPLCIRYEGSHPEKPSRVFAELDQFRRD